MFRLVGLDIEHKGFLEERKMGITAPFAIETFLNPSGKSLKIRREARAHLLKRGPYFRNVSLCFEWKAVELRHPKLLTKLARRKQRKDNYTQ